MYYKLNNAYALSPNRHSAVIIGRGTRDFVTNIHQPLEPLSRFATNRAKRMLLRDTTALNWLVATRADLDSRYQAGMASFATKPYMGSDPEFFLQDNGALLPAFEVLPGKEAKQHYFWDGFQAEFTTNAHLCIMQQIDSIQVRMIEMLCAARRTRANADFLAQDSFKIDPKGYAKEHLLLGCDPSLNAYGVSGEIPGDGSTLEWRFAGGHIHFGSDWLKNHSDKARMAAQIVRDLDKVVGVWSVGAGVPFETNKIRRCYYGLAGEFRLPPHGLEYRTLSNFWLCHPAITHCVMELARAVFQLSPLGLLDFWYGDEETVQGVINGYDVSYARKLLKANEKLFVEIFAAANETFQMSTVGPKRLAQKAFEVGMESIECVVPKPLAIEANWLLGERLAAQASSFFLRPAIRAGWRTWQELVQK